MEKFTHPQNPQEHKKEDEQPKIEIVSPIGERKISNEEIKERTKIRKQYERQKELNKGDLPTAQEAAEKKLREKAKGAA